MFEPAAVQSSQLESARITETYGGSAMKLYRVAGAGCIFTFLLVMSCSKRVRKQLEIKFDLQNRKAFEK